MAVSKGITTQLPEETMLGCVKSAAEHAFFRHVQRVTLGVGSVHVVLHGGRAVSFHGANNIDAMDLAVRCMRSMDEGEYVG